MVAVGDRRAEQLNPGGPDILDSRSHLYPDSLRTMGYDVGTTGFELVLSKDVAAVDEQYIADDVNTFLSAHGLSTTDIGAFVSHPGGPKVIEAIVANIPMGRTGQPDELGPLAVYLASPAAAYVTGAALFIDGGYTLW